MRTTRISLLLAILAVAVAPVMRADSATTMNVSVQVVARTILTIDRQPAQVTISAEDVIRGFVEVPAAVEFRVRSNAANGYAVEFEPVGYPFTRAEIAWDNQRAVVNADGSWLKRSYERGIQTARLDVRLALSSGVAPGTYAWPLALAANSL